MIPPAMLPEPARKLINALFAQILTPPASATPADKGDLVFEATSNTTLKLKFKGSDGTVRSVSLTLS